MNKQEVYGEVRFCYAKLRDIRDHVDVIDREFYDPETVARYCNYALDDIDVLMGYLRDVEIAIEHLEVEG